MPWSARLDVVGRLPEVDVQFAQLLLRQRARLAVDDLRPIELVQGAQYTSGTHYNHAAFRPWRLQALAFKAIRRLNRNYLLWRDFPYEYERDRLAIDLINGSEILREWVDDNTSRPGDLDALAQADEREWEETRRPFLLY